ncbi:type 4a pilus biogenesis protein PilO [Aliiglaciecola sp. 3_MG-2023]|uniref:type 4a pilus biogenesis protein PilO n=1 Tax=Aliiglaciecola sp. 3_MG-2023 TaxID=3062644 RepID=UPI0026E251C9|nr:type 4a pilus biogenesis protein PilO [Aliiglaciecola sp. 3_MG-2023]MDO6692049.1 type 4a pilus biogenesis protein PilO [Aliiglaciecola sp. 3_MG-2023]
MKFDVNKLKEMNELDFEQVANWPFEVKTVVALFVAILVSVGGYYGLISSKLPVLERVQGNEVELKQTFAAKYRIAVNLKAYEEQLARIEADFSSMLKSLPTSNETPGLIDDITFVGTTAGLNFKLINWQQEIPKEFYTELPIQMEVTGNYHEFGQFVSNIAALPRIVTLHNFDITQQGSELRLQLQAKTYRTAVSEQGQ